jgi:DNA-directed RNA polymerase specialized sigma24 family protein
MSVTFPSTRWSVIHRAGGELDDGARAAFDELCGAYWYPLFAYLRRSGTPAQDAADLVQGLFVSLLERQSLEGLERDGARFRSWLLGALRHHTQDVRAHDRADKRGGDRPHFPLDLEDAEGRYRREPATPEDPAALFDRAWAGQVLARGRARLDAEYRESGRGTTFDLLAPTLEGEAVDREGAERMLALSPVALRVAVHRLRTRYRDQLVEEVRDTLGPGEEPGTELNALLEALGADLSP